MEVLAVLNARDYYNYAIAKIESGDYQGAIADFDQAIKLKPDYVEAYYNRGIVKHDLGDYQ